MKKHTISYAELVEHEDAVLNNAIFYALLSSCGSSGWEQLNGWAEEEDDYDASDMEVYQWYVIGERFAERLQKYTREIVYYNSDLDLYLWGVTHFGTAWSYVNLEYGDED